MDWAVLLSCGVALPGMTIAMFYAIGRGSREAQETQRIAVERSRPSLPTPDPWTRIARFVPNIREDLEFLRDQWNAVDAGLDAGGLTTEEDALRRALRNDLPRIAETLEGAMAVAATEDERRMACARALASLEDLIDILKAHRQAIFDAASSDQQVVGRYLETKRDDVAPSGPLALAPRPSDVPRTPNLARHVARPPVAAPAATVASRRTETGPACSFCGTQTPETMIVSPGAVICAKCAQQATKGPADVFRRDEPHPMPIAYGRPMRMMDAQSASHPDEDRTRPRHGTIVGENHFF
jgi:hypothetical protein